MDKIIRIMAFYLIAGAACKAGEQIWEEGLSSKASGLIQKLKSKTQKKKAN